MSDSRKRIKFPELVSFWEAAKIFLRDCWAYCLDEICFPPKGASKFVELHSFWACYPMDLSNMFIQEFQDLLDCFLFKASYPIKISNRFDNNFKLCRADLFLGLSSMWNVKRFIMSFRAGEIEGTLRMSVKARCRK